LALELLLKGDNKCRISEGDAPGSPPYIHLRVAYCIRGEHVASFVVSFLQRHRLADPNEWYWCGGDPPSDPNTHHSYTTKYLLHATKAHMACSFLRVTSVAELWRRRRRSRRNVADQTYQYESALVNRTFTSQLMSAPIFMLCNVGGRRQSNI
jgi:hypothetical protein